MDEETGDYCQHVEPQSTDSAHQVVNANDLSDDQEDNANWRVPNSKRNPFMKCPFRIGYILFISGWFASVR